MRRIEPEERVIGNAAMLDPMGPVPLYHQIFLLFQEKILSGEIGFGESVPGENEVSRKYGVSRITAKRALDDLAAAGLVKRARGRGTSVAYRHFSPPVTSSVESWLENAALMGLRTEAEVLSFEYVPATHEVAGMLGCEHQASVQRAIRVRRVGGVPFSYLVTFVPEKIGRTYSADDLVHTPILSLIEKCEVRLGSARQTISATLADASVAHALDVHIGAPLIEMRRVVYDTEDAPVEFIRAFYRPDRYQYEMTLTRDTGPAVRWSQAAD